MEVVPEVLISLEVIIKLVFVAIKPEPNTYCGVAGPAPLTLEYTAVPVVAVNRDIEPLNDSVATAPFAIKLLVVEISNL